MVDLFSTSVCISGKSRSKSASPLSSCRVQGVGKFLFFPRGKALHLGPACTRGSCLTPSHWWPLPPDGDKKSWQRLKLLISWVRRVCGLVLIPWQRPVTTSWPHSDQNTDECLLVGLFHPETMSGPAACIMTGLSSPPSLPLIFLTSTCWSQGKRSYGWCGLPVFLGSPPTPILIWTIPIAHRGRLRIL